jgi:hypothetical protein
LVVLILEGWNSLKNKSRKGRWWLGVRTGDKGRGTRRVGRGRLITGCFCGGVRAGSERFESRRTLVWRLVDQWMRL